MQTAKECHEQRTLEIERARKFKEQDELEAHDLVRAINSNNVAVKESDFDEEEYQAVATEGGIQKLRKSQVAVLTLFAITAKKFTFMELPTSFGKTTILWVYAGTQARLDAKAKIIISVPNTVLKCVTEDQCVNRNPNPKAGRI